MVIQPHLQEETRLWGQGYRYLAGIDEAGRGAWAGPVVAAAVILPPDADLARLLPLVRDSKTLSPQQRERCYDKVLAHALSFGVGSVPASEIDRQGIIAATREAMRQAVAALAPAPDYLLIDALSLPTLALPQFYRSKGDRDCLSIAAASIIAKVTRDRYMLTLDQCLPGYGLAAHKGYGTALHRRALHQLGPSEYHRLSFAPLRALAQDAAACCHDQAVDEAR